MGSMPENSGSPTVAEGCRDIDRMPITMEHSIVTCQDGRRKQLPTCPGHKGSNIIIITLHLVVPNPYTLLSILPLQASWFTCRDLKDTFFCLCLALISQPLFGFEWEDPPTVRKTQMARTRVPQGFKTHPPFFGKP
jgi:hypothetical protein